MLSLHTKFTSISSDVTPSSGGCKTCRYHGWCTFHEIEARAIPVQLLTSTLQTNLSPVNAKVCTILHKLVPPVLHNSMRIKSSTPCNTTRWTQDMVGWAWAGCMYFSHQRM